MKKKELIAYNPDNDQAFEVDVVNGNQIIYQSKEQNISIEQTPDGFTLMSINGKQFPVEIISNHQNEYELMVNGVSYNFSIETPFSLRRKKVLLNNISETSVIRLKAPMPGKILEVLVKTGDSVNAGDTLVVLEAMKMQNAILASIKGTIKKVHVKENDAISKSDLLIEIQKDL